MTFTVTCSVPAGGEYEDKATKEDFLPAPTKLSRIFRLGNRPRVHAVK